MRFSVCAGLVWPRSHRRRTLDSFVPGQSARRAARRKPTLRGGMNHACGGGVHGCIDVGER